MSQAKRAFLWETPPELWRGYQNRRSTLARQDRLLFTLPRNQPSRWSPCPRVRAYADRGLEGDRFFRDSWNAAKRPDKAVTLIEEETLEIAAEELGTEMFGDKTRRNIVTRGVPLIDLLRSRVRHRRCGHARAPAL